MINNYFLDILIFILLIISLEDKRLQSLGVGLKGGQ